jgi:prepilin-type N-terminal cleavage/methylation domain-containing protein
MNTPQPRCTRHHGLGLIELLLSLAIGAILLLAVAAAFNASAHAVAINDATFRAGQTARITLAQVQARIRTCQDCQVGDSYDGHSTTVSADTLNFHDPDGTQYAYVYDADTKTLALTNVATSESHILAHHLEKPAGGYLFTADMQPDPASQAMRPIRISLAFRVHIDNTSIPLAASSVPRRATIR